MSVYLETPPMKKFLTHLNIHTKKPLETVDTPISNYSLIKPVTTIQKEIGSVTSFGLIRLSAEQSPQILEKGFSNYYKNIKNIFTTIKIFNKNTVKVSYCCTQNVASIIKSHNKKLINTSIKALPCNCKKKRECPLDGKWRTENIA